MAKDKGTPSLNSTVTVTIAVATGTSIPPSWDMDYDQKVYSVDETAPVGTLIASMSCNSNIDDERVEFQIIQEDGSSSQSTGTFSIAVNGNTMNLLVDGKLDYETVSSYTVRLRCLVSTWQKHDHGRVNHPDLITHLFITFLPVPVSHISGISLMSIAL